MIFKFWKSWIYLTLLCIIFPVRGNFSPKSTSDDVKKLVTSCNELGLKIFRNAKPNENISISPLSIMVLIGSISSGLNNATAREIQKILKLPSVMGPSFKEILKLMKPVTGKTNVPFTHEIEMANAILIDDEFSVLSSFKDDSQHNFDATVEKISFSRHPEAVVDAINGWVDFKTQHKIKKMLHKPLDLLTKVFVMNAIYFKGAWKLKFDQRLTSPDTFYNGGEIPKTVPMMRQKKRHMYAFNADLQSHILMLPYEGERFHMTILLPEKRDGLADLESKLTWTHMNLERDLREDMVQVTLPRFDLMQHHDLVPVFRKLGISSLLDADLSGISSSPGLHVSTVMHSCSLKVNEEGSEAASSSGMATGVRTGGGGAMFTADHPFIFAIKDNYLDLVLFYGRVSHF